MSKRRVMGKRLNRLDGPPKATGRVKYAQDVKPAGMLYGALLVSPYAHARVKSIDASGAEQTKGVAGVRIVAPAGTEIQWEGMDIAVVAASTEAIARDAVRKIKVEYEVLPHMVNEKDLGKAGGRIKAAGQQVTGDPDQAFKDADVVSEGVYGCPVLTHCCMESHGGVLQWQGEKVEFWPSTQGVTDITSDLARGLKVPAASVHVIQEAIGGGFGSKFATERCALEAAHLSKSAGGKPVRMFLDRAQDLKTGGNRPSAWIKAKVGARKDGTIVAWQSESWATGGVGGGGMPPLPYVYTNIPNRRLNHSAVSTNAGGARAWRAPNHPQASFLTACALEDLAAKLNMDPLVLLAKNADYTARGETYRRQLAKAAELSDWKKLWHPRGASGSGVVKRGLGVGFGTWGGAGHASQCRTIIHADGSVEVELGSQDLGTGTRTIIAMVAAETLGLPVQAVKVKIGDNRYPPSGSSGGSTTVGGVSSSTRKSTTNALTKLFELAAPALGAPADQLEAAEGKIWVTGNPAKSITWAAACRKLGKNTITEMGANDPKLAPKEGLNTQGVGGVQIADVEVDTETGVVKLKKLTVVQDCGLIVNPKTAETQVYGACIMAICGALFEERIMCDVTGRMLNSDFDTYKLAGAGDIGEIVCHLEIDPDNDKRGIIGLGEPPVVPGMGAIANAVANAIGVRVPTVPLTPDKVLAALERRNA
ncbi:MAG: xanthine dehydrogenase family protein molybdopterin-binding subunit [Acidobacteria bacterium]|nr:xanthine dehydrogenase family protein molybdopterin-binding subunit [Acidobacteriota bacterium]